MLAALATALTLALAACGGDDEQQAAEPVDTNTGTASETVPADEAASGQKTSLKADADPSGALEFTKTELSAKPGEVTITMDNPSQIPHGVAIEGNGVDVAGQVVDNGETSEATATLAAGEYEFYCPVPGHAPVMRGTLTVK